MLQAGLFDDSPRSREIIYNFMRLRALRVEVDVKLALGEFSMTQAAEYLAEHVPMDKKTARGEAALFATTPGQAISYQIGKSQILHFLAAAKLAQGDKFNLRRVSRLPLAERECAHRAATMGISGQRRCAQASKAVRYPDVEMAKCRSGQQLA